jgi:hypothetical protein
MSVPPPCGSRLQHTLLTSRRPNVCVSPRHTGKKDKKKDAKAPAPAAVKSTKPKEEKSKCVNATFVHVHIDCIESRRRFGAALTHTVASLLCQHVLLLLPITPALTPTCTFLACGAQASKSERGSGSRGCKTCCCASSCSGCVVQWAGRRHVPSTRAGAVDRRRDFQPRRSRTWHVRHSLLQGRSARGRHTRGCVARVQSSCCGPGARGECARTAL